MVELKEELDHAILNDEMICLAPNIKTHISATRETWFKKAVQALIPIFEKYFLICCFKSDVV